MEGTDSAIENAADKAAQQEENIESTPSMQERTALYEQLKPLLKQLEEMQGDKPLILPSVDEQAVGSVVADWKTFAFLVYHSL